MPFQVLSAEDCCDDDAQKRRAMRVNCIAEVACCLGESARAIATMPSSPFADRLDDSKPSAVRLSGDQVTKSKTSVTISPTFLPLPTQVTTDGHDSYPREIRETLGPKVKHRCNAYRTGRLSETTGA